jgi:triacylglycerol lipase
MSPAVTKSRNKMVRLSGKKADEFAFKSCLKGPISELSVLQRSLLFAEVSMIAYLSTEECNLAAGKLGFTDGKFFEGEGAQAFWFQNEHDSVVVFRGPEVSQRNDIAGAAKMSATLAETVGKVHPGIKSTVDEIWPRIETALEKNNKTLWFTGHGLGGAIANICAGRCMLSYIKTEPEGLYSFGSPRVGSRRYVNYVKFDHFRWVNNNDIVASVPPVRLGFQHSGKEMRIDRFGRLKEGKGWSSFADRIWVLTAGIRRFSTDPLLDHSPTSYVDCIFNVVRAQEAKAGTDNSQTVKSEEVDSQQGGNLELAPDFQKTGSAENKRQMSA